MLKQNTYSGGTNGATITSGNSGGTSGDAWQQLTGTPTYNSSQATGLRAPMAGSYSSGSSATTYWSGLSYSGRQLWCRDYIYITASPGGSDYFTSFQNTPGTVLISIRLETNRTLTIRNELAAGTFAAGSVPVPTNQWVRVEASVTVGTTTGNGACELRLFTAADAGTAAEITSANNINLGTLLPDWYGVNYASNLTVLHDDVAVTDLGFLGPRGVTMPQIPAMSRTAVHRAANW